MSEYHEVLEEDKAYLEEVGMRTLLQQFVADAMEDHPANVYEYMALWAAKKAASESAADEGAADNAAEAYPVEGSPEGAAHSADAVSGPDSSLHPHRNSFGAAHPASDVPDAETSTKGIEQIAHGGEDTEEL